MRWSALTADWGFSLRPSCSPSLPTWEAELPWASTEGPATPQVPRSPAAEAPSPRGDLRAPGRGGLQVCLEGFSTSRAQELWSSGAVQAKGARRAGYYGGRGTKQRGRRITGAGHHAVGRGTAGAGHHVVWAGHHRGEAPGVLPGEAGPGYQKREVSGLCRHQGTPKVLMRPTPTEAVSSGQGGPARLSEAPWPTASLTQRLACGCAFAVGVSMRVLH